MTTYLGFFISIIAILIVARKSLPLALFCGAVILGLFTASPFYLFKKIIYVFTDPSVIFLSLAMGVIPMIGGVMKESGQMEALVNNLRIGRKGLKALSPAIMGLLPMSGGALFSAPILEKGGEGVSENLKAATNVWFRHLFILIYPLSPALIVSAKISNLSLYTAVIYLLPCFVLALILGYIFFIRKLKGNIVYQKPFSLYGLLLPLGIILVAPAIDFTLKKISVLPVKEIATLIGVCTAFFLSCIFSGANLNLKEIFKSMKPWNFSLIIIGMFLFMHVFQSTNVSDLIATINLPPTTLCAVAGFILGIVNGRVTLAASIILPVYLSTGTISPLAFSIIYTSIFFGYVISPVHPCVCVSCEYFNVTMKNFLKLLTLPTFIIFSIMLLISIFFI